jgi:hypothetical protein
VFISVFASSAQFIPTNRVGLELLFCQALKVGANKQRLFFCRNVSRWKKPCNSLAGNHRSPSLQRVNFPLIGNGVFHLNAFRRAFGSLDICLFSQIFAIDPTAALSN